MSFWNQSPGPSWSHYMKSLWNGEQPPSIFRDTFPKPAFSYSLIQSTDCSSIVWFLRDHYSIYPRSKVSLTEDSLRNAIVEQGWIGIAIRFRTVVAGCVFLRPLGYLMAGTKTIENQKALLVDFFCVNKPLRKTGIGSKLLHACVYEGSQRGYNVFFFVKEGLPHLLCPPLRTSTYIWRPRTVPMPMNLKEFVKIVPSLPHPTDLWTLPESPSSARIYQCSAPTSNPPIYVCVTDMYHRSLPDGKTMGEILWVWHDTTKGTHDAQRIQRVVETVVDMVPYDLVFCDKSIPHDVRLWTTDATYSWYAFNLHPSRFFSTDLALTF